MNYVEAAHKNPRWEVAGVVARTPATVATACTKYGLSPDRGFTDFDQALDHCDADVVAITTPNQLHASQALAALQRGKHVFIEKPITETWPDAQALLAACELRGVRAAVGHVLRGDYMLRLIANRVAAGIIGTVESVTMDCAWFWVPAATWRFGLGNMYLEDIAIHQIDALRMILGNRRCQRLVARCYKPPSYPATTLSSVTSIWEMEDDVHVSFTASMAARGQSRGWPGQFTITGSEGSLHYDGKSDTTIALAGNDGVITRQFGLDAEYGDDADEYLDFLEVQHIPYLLEEFAQAVTEGRPSVTDLRDSVHSHAIMLAIKASSDQTRWVDVTTEYRTE
jgi:predicted dehydrogenase